MRFVLINSIPDNFDGDAGAVASRFYGHAETAFPEDYSD
jgi:hypothetical protein